MQTPANGRNSGKTWRLPQQTLNWIKAKQTNAIGAIVKLRHGIANPLNVAQAVTTALKNFKGAHGAT